jgi:hypothetical protein
MAVEDAFFWAECYVGRFGMKTGPLTINIRYQSNIVFSQDTEALTGDVLCSALRACADYSGRLPRASALPRGNGQ